MPRRSILSAVERESLLALPDNRDDLIRRYTLSESDLSIIRQHRGAANRLGFAVQLCYLRFPGSKASTSDAAFMPVSTKARPAMHSREQRFSAASAGWRMSRSMGTRASSAAAGCSPSARHSTARSTDHATAPDRMCGKLWTLTAFSSRRASSLGPSPSPRLWVCGTSAFCSFQARAFGERQIHSPPSSSKERCPGPRDAHAGLSSSRRAQASPPGLALPVRPAAARRSARADRRSSMRD